jgi:hypothetical protein
MLSFSLWQRRQRLKHYRHDVEGSIASSDPLIASGQTLKDLLEHTTSGSGSGISVIMFMFGLFC